MPNVLANSRAACSVSRVLHRLFRELIGCAVLAGLGALAACTSLTGSSIASTTVTTFSPVTDIQVDSQTMFERLGCGTSARVPFKYVATVYPCRNAAESARVYTVHPLDHLHAEGFEIERLERSKLGIVERVAARRR